MATRGDTWRMAMLNGTGMDGVPFDTILTQVFPGGRARVEMLR